MNDNTKTETQTFDKKNLVIPILIMTVGLGWLASTIGFAPEIFWIWTLGLGIAGIMTFVLNGLDKVSVVAGPFLIVASIFSVLRQSNILPINIEVPCLVVLFGFLTLVAQQPSIKSPEWILQGKSND